MTLANMNLPGVRRIEALIAVLKTKEKEEIAKLTAILPNFSDIEAMVDEEFGITEIRVQLKKAVESASAAIDKREKALLKELIETPQNEVRRKYAEKESALWLVESIEEAKAIVYGDE